MVDKLADDTLKRISRKRRFATGAGAFAVILALMAALVAIVLYLVEGLILLALRLLGMHRARRKTER